MKCRYAREAAWSAVAWVWLEDFDGDTCIMKTNLILILSEQEEADGQSSWQFTGGWCCSVMW